MTSQQARAEVEKELHSALEHNYGSWNTENLEFNWDEGRAEVEIGQTHPLALYAVVLTAEELVILQQHRASK